MIPKSKLDWQQALIEAVTDPLELGRLLDLPPAFLSVAKASKRFPLKVPRGFIARMQKGNLQDPLFRQIWPFSDEDAVLAPYSLDPLGEEAVNPAPGLLHKYQGRVLLTLTGACAINCRYCFRRHFPYTANNPSQEGWEEAFAYIEKETSIQEVILSGGDPLLLPERVLKTVTERLASLPHLKRFRIHSRIPILIPERITDDFLAWVASFPQELILVTHCNHPQEIDETVAEAMQKLKSAAVYLLNQAVLLKGINNELAVLVALSERLFSVGILPYYLHRLDKVQGAAHFDLPFQEAQELYRQLSHHLPGYLLPKFAEERAGAQAKILIGT